MYAAELGRFLGRDPIGFRDDWSLYRAHFVPNGLDPSGFSVLSPIQRDCIGDCLEGCDELYGWWNPQRYVCRSYCDNACLHTPDILDEAYACCPTIRQLAQRSNCLCAVLQVADFAPGFGQLPGVYLLDLLCSETTVAVMACDAADSGKIGDYIKTGAMTGLAVGDLLGEYVDLTNTTDAILAGAQNLIATGNLVGPQKQCACELATMGADTAAALVDGWREIVRRMRTGKRLPMF
jgi:hypothetical protein